MVMKDFGIKSEEDFVRTMGEVAERLGDELENNPLLERAHLAAERLVRTVAANISISDLPKGKRM